MIARIIDASVRHRVLVLMIWLLIAAWGLYAMYKIPVDAIPDLSDVQVIISTDFPGQAPQVVEDQVTYPLTTAMLSVPYAKVVRGFSMFGVSLVYVIFEDGTDIYWARSRVLEYLNFARGKLPPNVSPALGPDATGVGWVFQYVVEDPTGKHDSGPTAQHSGLVPALSVANRPRGLGSSLGGRFCQKLSGGGGPQ